MRVRMDMGMQVRVMKRVRMRDRLLLMYAAALPPRNWAIMYAMQLTAHILPRTLQQGVVRRGEGRARGVRVLLR